VVVLLLVLVLLALLALLVLTLLICRVPPGAHSHSTPPTPTPPPPTPSCPRSVPAGFTCFKDGPSFAKALLAGRDKLALVCPAASPCTINGLGPPLNVEKRLVMENVLIQNNKASGISPGGLLGISNGGSVTGTNVTFRNGSTPL